MLHAVSGIGTHGNLGYGKALANNLHDFFSRLTVARAGIGVAGAQPSPNRHVTEETKQRQRTKVTILAVKKAAFLAAVPCVVSAIKIEHKKLLNFGQTPHAELEDGSFCLQGI